MPWVSDDELPRAAAVTLAAVRDPLLHLRVATGHELVAESLVDQDRVDALDLLSDRDLAGMEILSRESERSFVEIEHDAAALGERCVIPGAVSSVWLNAFVHRIAARNWAQASRLFLPGKLVLWMRRSRQRCGCMTHSGISWPSG
jgi:hypothetical protein